MSRIGKIPVPIPSGIKVSVQGNTIRVEGSVGKLSMNFRSEIDVKVDESAKAVVVTRKKDDRLSRSLHGLTRSLIANMIEGCSKGYVKSLEIYGVGFSVQIQGKKLVLNVGYSHPVEFDIPEGLNVTVDAPQARGETEPAKFTLKGADKQVVGEFAARTRKSRKPEPYKGKGVRYVGEYVRRKAGKQFAGAGGGS